MVVFCARFTIILTLHPINFINPINRVKQQRSATRQTAVVLLLMGNYFFFAAALRRLSVR